MLLRVSLVQVATAAALLAAAAGVWGQMHRTAVMDGGASSGGDMFTTTAAGSRGDTRKPVFTCCDEPRVMSVSGEAEQTVANTITKVVLSVRVTDSVPIDTTPAIDINLQQQLMAAGVKPGTGGGSGSGSGSGSQLPTTPNAKQLDAMARSVMQQATSRTSNVLALLQATSAERLQTQGVSLQPTSVWVPKLSQSVNNGYAASNTISFRIASSAMGSLLADVLRLGATNIDSVTHTATEADLEAGRRAAIRVATRRALARAQLAANAMASTPRLDIKNVQVSTSSSGAPRAMPQPVMFMSARADAAPSGGAVSTDVAGETEIIASVALQVEVLGYAALNVIDAADVM